MLRRKRREKTIVVFNCVEAALGVIGDARKTQNSWTISRRLKTIRTSAKKVRREDLPKTS